MKKFYLSIILLIAFGLAVVNANAHDVGSATLSWTAPTQNEDATPLTDLDGFKLYMATVPGGPYPTLVDVQNPGVTTFVIGGLAVGNWFFVATAYNTAGVESQFSNQASKTVVSESHTHLPSVPNPPTNLTVNGVPSTDPLIVSNTIPSSYEWGTLAIGELAYVDRTYTFTTIPASLIGLDYLRTANSDKDSTSGITFDVNKQATVFVAHDTRFPALPTWLASWTATGMVSAWDSSPFDIYSKGFPAGTVTLGGNNDSGANINSMYNVIISE